MARELLMLSAPDERISATQFSMMNPSPSVFRLAPMTPDFRVLTWFLWVLAVVYRYSACTVKAPVTMVSTRSTVFIVLVYASVWLAFRPSGFEVDNRVLRIVWPVWRRTIARGDILDARVISWSAFRNEYGYGMRIGAGGLWGGFGLLKTSRETFSMWISRSDRFVLVRLRGARTLLLTPEDPERFVAMLANPSSPPEPRSC
jgi:hypothetical protein